MTLSETDREALIAAVCRLERQSFASRIAALTGRPVGLVSRVLPAPASNLLAQATTRALEGALDIALFTLRDGPLARARLARGRVVHSVLACASGAIGGAFGLTALAIELPVSTAIMLRAIAAIAQSEGEDLADQRTGLACLEVFALGAATANGGEPNSDPVRIPNLIGTIMHTLFDVGKFRVTRGVSRELLQLADHAPIPGLHD